MEGNHPLVAWIARHQAQLLTRFRIYDDGKTAVERLTGRRWGRSALMFGERVLFVLARSREGRRKRDYEPRLQPGWYVGHHSRSGSMVMLTAGGVVKARIFRRLPESERIVHAEIDELKGLP